MTNEYIAPTLPSIAHIVRSLRTTYPESPEHVLHTVVLNAMVSYGGNLRVGSDDNGDNNNHDTNENDLACTHASLMHRIDVALGTWL